MLNKTTGQIILLISVAVISVMKVYSQTGNQDTLNTFKTFNKVCVDYQHFPLQLEMEVINSTNLVANEMDTLHLSGVFDIQKSGSYFQMNDQEEVINDSFLLIADSRLKRLMLYHQNGNTTAEMLRSFQRSFISDSSIASMTAKYKVLSGSANNKSGNITIASKERLQHINLPVEEVEAKYNHAMEPQTITLINRALYTISQSVYDSLYKQESNRRFLVKKDGIEGFFYLKETRAVTQFKSISHKERSPYKTLDSYVSLQDKRYQPQPAYKDYILKTTNKF